MSFLQLELSAAFPSVPVFPALGNNDAYCGDYGVSGQSGFLTDIAAIWQPLVGAPLSSFSQAGDYTVPHPVVPKLDFVMFNDVPFSENYGEYTFAYAGDPDAQQACTANAAGDLTSAESSWLETTLADATGKVILAFHIPPGIDQYNTASDNLPQLDCDSLKVDFDLGTAVSASFATTLAGNRDKIQSVFAAHTHQDDFRVFKLIPPPSTTRVAPLAIRFNPSISIHNSNNPGFQIFTYNPADGALLDYTTYYLSNIDIAGTPEPQHPNQTVKPDWQPLYTFSQDYLTAGGIQATGLNADSLNQLVGKLRSDTTFAQSTYWDYHSLRGEEQGGGAITRADWAVYSCSLDSLTELEFSNCICPSS